MIQNQGLEKLRNMSVSSKSMFGMARGGGNLRKFR